MMNARRFGFLPLAWALVGFAGVGCDDEKGAEGGPGGGSLAVKYDGKTTKASIDEASAGDATKLVIRTFPGCGDGTTPKVALAVRGATPARKPTAVDPYGLRGTPPEDVEGDCGGRETYVDYTHENGVTKGTLSFLDYCSTDDSGKTTKLNADVSFVDNGTPSDLGPVRQSLTANCPEFGMDSSDGRSLSGGFAGVRFVPGTPGQAATDAAPDTLTLGESVVRNNETKETTRASDLTFTLGATEGTVEGEVCGADLGCVTVTTNEGSPIARDLENGTFTGGSLTMEGADGTTAELEILPGADLGVEVVAINGDPLPSGSLEVVCSSL
jgi:hypothetical protein